MNLRMYLAAGLCAALAAASLSAAADPNPLQVLGAADAAAKAKPPAPASKPTATVVSARDPQTVPAFGKLLNDGYKPRFLRHDDQLGLDIWFLMNQDNTPAIFYVTGDGCCIIGGNVWETDKNGALFYGTGAHIVEASTLLAREGILPAPSATGQGAAQATQTAPAAQAQSALAQPVQQGAQAAPDVEKLTGTAMLGAFEKTQWFEIGKASAPLIYLVADPECPYCHMFWQAVQPFIAKGNVRVRIILTAALAAENSNRSFTSATAILAAADSAAAWRSYIEDKKIVDITDAAQVAKGVNKLAENERMRSAILLPHDMRGVPIVLWRNKEGKLGYNYGFDAGQVPDLVKMITSVSMASAR